MLSIMWLLFVDGACGDGVAEHWLTEFSKLKLKMEVEILKKL